MKAGIMFHPTSPYYAVCADVVLVIHWRGGTARRNT